MRSEEEKLFLTKPNDENLKTRSGGRKRSAVFIVIVFFLFMQVGLHAGRKSRAASSPNINNQRTKSRLSSSMVSSSEKGDTLTGHPITKLMADAEDKFRSLLFRQSKSLPAAVAEYKRRYGRNPPKGFDDWFQFCLEHNVLMIDEYNALDEDLKPFWNMSTVELRRRTEQIGATESIDLLRIEDGNVIIMRFGREYPDKEVSSRTKGFRAMVQKYIQKLPDMDFAINAKAEGRILIPWEHKMYPNLTKQDSSGGLQDMLGADFRADWHGEGNVWEAYRRVCPVDSPARRVLGSLRHLNAPTSFNYLKNVSSHKNRIAHTSSSSNKPSTGVSVSKYEYKSIHEAGEDFEFVNDTSYAFDYCSHPWAHYLQGHFFSDWRTMAHLYPVFSPAKAAGYSDIRIPSHYYHNPTPAYTYGWDRLRGMLREDGRDEWEVDWEEKVEKIFWRGATTGGGNSPSGFQPNYQRHRYVRMTSDISDSERTIVIQSPTGPTAPTQPQYISTTLPISTLNREIMDVGFTSATGSESYPGGLDALKASHRFADSVPLGGNWQYKYLVDLDGMGYSARYFALLASDSAVIKSTVYREYFEDWIQPWLHFIPLSQSYKEIYNIYAFFSGPTQGILSASDIQLSPNSSILTTTPSKNINGDRRLRRIARAGKNWKNTIGRPIDMEAYVYRLCLEWARLWAHDRDSMDFILDQSSS